MSTEQRERAGEPVSGEPSTGGGQGHTTDARTVGLAIAALGVVFGDIGTNPLFAVRETLEGPGHLLAVVEANVL